jgi:hypothetical protein
MAKPDWGALQDQFLAEHAKTGISPKDWCEAQGLNYASAKRYIKVTSYGAKSQKEAAKKMRIRKRPKAGVKNPTVKQAAPKIPDAKPIRGSRTAPPQTRFPAWQPECTEARRLRSPDAAL